MPTNLTHLVMLGSVISRGRHETPNSSRHGLDRALGPAHYALGGDIDNKCEIMLHREIYIICTLNWSLDPLPARRGAA
jgi:hypothetical protein